MNDWAIDREIFCEEAAKLRSRFDSNRNCSPEKAHKVLIKGQAELAEFTHPDPYRIPHMPGGSMFMRNPPLPMEICFPDGDLPADAPKVELNPDMSICREGSGKSYDGRVLVDFTTKVSGITEKTFRCIICWMNIVLTFLSCLLFHQSMS